MEVKELRIGNLMNVNGEVREVGALDKNSVAFVLKGCKIAVGSRVKLITHCEPIPLTEKWLVRLGFEMDDSQLDPPDTPSGNFWVDWEKDGVRICMPFFEYLHDEISIEIKHVHQLQNLYFALTGEELELKD